jgi:hypothetical protein
VISSKKEKKMSKMFGGLTKQETSILASKLMSGAVTSDWTHGNGQHDLTMELYDVVGDVQENWKSGDLK